ncbi:MAG: flagellar biosynthesis anti-sigma factor FlgM [Polyangiales bacterium]|jgi:flagellar biosynthesis anti-sigma factor FlgM
MRVQGTSPINPLRTTSTQNAAPSRSERPKDGAEVSLVATQLADSKAPEVIDAKRVERLKATIANGTFTINADTIAARMLAEES